MSLDVFLYLIALAVSIYLMIRHRNARRTPTFPLGDDDYEEGISDLHRWR